MKVSNRELVLGWFTLVVVLLAGTYWFVAPRVSAWKESTQRMEDIAREIQLTRHRIEQRPTWEGRLSELRGQLPSHDMSKEVTAELLKNLEQTAREHGLSLLRREPEAEENRGDGLYEVAIHCTWEGELSALVHFLYAIQMQGVILDIRQLTVTPTQGPGESLKGSFTVDCAYTRQEAVPGGA